MLNLLLVFGIIFVNIAVFVLWGTAYRNCEKEYRMIMFTPFWMFAFGCFNKEGNAARLKFVVLMVIVISSYLFGKDYFFN